MQRPPTNSFFAYALILTLVGSLFSVVLPASQQSFASHENITLTIGDAVSNIYDPGDSVAIEGIIDDVQENEDVEIRVLDPSGDPEDTDDVTPDEDDGYFDFLFDIPDNADGGVWTFEVSYDGDEAFSYFMVEYDEDDVDVITVELDATNGIYEADDTVTIEGAVDDVEDGEEFVEIIVVDPTNEEIYNEDEVELGDGTLEDDEFEYEFDLDDAHGRYAVMVTYAGSQEGAAVLEIEDEGSEEEEESNAVTEGTDGDLYAEIDEELYAQGGTVVITGEIDNYDTEDDLDLGISIRDPDDEEIDEEDNADVEDNGDFTFEYDIDDNADVGDYTVTVTYDNDEVELIFEVEEGEDDGGSSGDLTVRLNKASYLAGETMTVTGTVAEVADPEDGELLSILLYDPDSRVILAAGSSKYVTPSTNGAYSATVVVPSDLEEGDDYTVSVSYLEETVEATFAITGVSETPGDEITVVTDEDEYDVGQTVEISGQVPATLLTDGEPLVIRINKPDGSPCRIDQVEIPSSGSYDYDMVVGGTCGVAGEYEIEVTYGGEEGSTTFDLIGSSVSEYSLIVEGDTYPVEYEMSGGSINNMFVRPAENKLVITVDAEEAGQLVVALPREVIDAVEDGEDIAYIVTIEDDSGNVSKIEIEESENTDDARTLVIDYEAGTGRIEIAGTQVVPEFGAIAAIVMAIAIVGIIIATARYNKFSLFGQ